jgi:hypothetical protein
MSPISILPLTSVANQTSEFVYNEENSMSKVTPNLKQKTLIIPLSASPAKSTLPLVTVKYYAKSLTLAALDTPVEGQGEHMYELREVTEHKTVKGIKGFQYKCVWAKNGVEPTWEPDTHIKPTAEKLLNLYWRSATKSSKPDSGSNPSPPTPMKQGHL